MPVEFEFIGGDVSLDLVNTLMHRSQPRGPDELLTGGEDALRWFVQAELLSPGQQARLDPESVLIAARRLRSALDAVYRPLARREQSGESFQRGLSTLNAVLDQGRERVQVRLAGSAFVRDHHFEVVGPPDPNTQVARSAADLLHRLHPHRLKECENPACDLLFYDDSRNGSRRWCSMQGCGNALKQARHRHLLRGP